VNDDGSKWTYFVKIVAAPDTAMLFSGTWYSIFGGIEIGPMIWGSFAILQEIVNDPSTGEHGRQYGSPAGPGVGKW
jgi:hypothetical protein